MTKYITLKEALAEVKLIESLSLYQCILLDRMKTKRIDLYNKLKDKDNIKEIKEIIEEFMLWEN